MEELFLIYVNAVGKDYQNNYIYEFIYSAEPIGVDGEKWDSYPASNRPSPPYEQFISKVCRLESELRLDVVQESDTFSVWDAVDGVIALAWENIDYLETYPEVRLCFKFLEPYNSVEEKLYEKDLVFKNIK